MYVPSKNFSPEVAEKIEMVSCRKVTREDLRPDIDWSLIR
jgi:DNA-binding transcriptional regulator YdaS (Cro superfamily)